MTDFDVIVVGGGPAGSMAAHAAASGGLRTIILEKDREIGVPVRCGEAVSDEGLRQFMEPRPAWIAATIDHVRMHSPAGHAIEFDAPHSGYVLHRRIFDYALANRAAGAGAQVQTRAYVTGLRMEGEQVTGVRYQYMGEQKELSARLVIAADGVESRVGRMAGIRTALKLADTESCYQVTVGNVDIEQDVLDFWVGAKYAPGGYLWIFPKGDGMANIGLGIEGNYSREVKAYDQIHDFLARHFPEASILTAVCGCVPVAKTLKKITGDGIMLTGDAAHMVNPVSGGGIISGMHGGKLAGEVAVEALAAGNVSAKYLEIYRKRWHKAGGRNHERLHRISEGITQLSDQNLDDMAEELARIPKEKLSLLKIFTSAAKRKPGILLDVTRAFAGF